MLRFSDAYIMHALCPNHLPENSKTLLDYQAGILWLIYYLCIDYLRWIKLSEVSMYTQLSSPSKTLTRNQKLKPQKGFQIMGFLSSSACVTEEQPDALLSCSFSVLSPSTELPTTTQTFSTLILSLTIEGSQGQRVWLGGHLLHGCLNGSKVHPGNVWGPLRKLLGLCPHTRLHSLTWSVAF